MGMWLGNGCEKGYVEMEINWSAVIWIGFIVLAFVWMLAIMVVDRSCDAEEKRLG